MPLYDYKCEKCDQTLEIITKRDPEQKLIHWEAAELPKGCEGTLVREIINKKVATIFKGSGWYSSDYKGIKH